LSHVSKSPNIGSIFVLQLNPVRITLIPYLDDNTWCKTLFNISKDLITNLETKEVFSFAVQEALLECLIIKVTSDEDKLADTFLIILPSLDIFVEASGEKHVHTLENEFLISTFDGKNTLVTEEVSTLTCNDFPDPVVQEIDIEFSLEGPAARRDGQIVLMF